MQFEWDDRKDRQNLRKHDIEFETARQVFEDPHAVTRRDASHECEEERFITIGTIFPGSVILVVHTWREERGEEWIRIISARAATARERRFYESTYQKPKAGHRRNREKKR